MTQNPQDGSDGLFGDDDDEARFEASRAPLLSHLTELRSRLIQSGIALLAGFVFCFFFAEQIYLFLVQPFAFAQNLIGRDEPISLIYTAPLELFFVKLKLSLFASLCLCFPFLAWQFYRFVAPGLYASEKKAMLPYLVAAPGLFLLGGAMVYFVMMPLVMRLALNQEIPPGGEVSIELLPKVSDYLSLITTLIVAFGLSFQLPIILSLLARAGLVQAKSLRKGRKYAVVGIFIFAAFMTPPDLISQFLLAIPVLGLYELGIWFAILSQNAREKALARYEEEVES